MPKVPTTAGEIDAAELGPVLMHEHVFLRTEALQLGWPGFGGWDAEAEVAAARERLRPACTEIPRWSPVRRRALGSR